MEEKSDIRGIFEIHITVGTEGDSLHRLWKYCSVRPTIKIVLAVADEGRVKNQYMISKYKSGTTAQMISTARLMASQLKSAGLTILRVKVEAMADNDGVPRSDADMDRYLSVTDKMENPNPYFEFHTKIVVGKDHVYRDLQQTLSEFQSTCGHRRVFANVSINLCGSKVPLMTLRIYDMGRDRAYAIKDRLFEFVKSRGFRMDGKTQYEFSVYDSNESIDEGWLTPIPSKL